jgi:proline iminopeptidase
MKYPEIEANKSGFLQVDAEHSIYWEESGNPSGVPIVFLHGGPGSNSEPKHRRFFDPKHYRIVLLDQRGAGRSTPFASLNNNTTWHLVSDLEALRERLKISKWFVFGGSWGSTLALSYAITHPDRVMGLILRGIFLCRPSEIRWFYQYGAHHLFPEEWERYTAQIPSAERGDMVQAYYKQLTSSDEALQLRAAQAWSRWEGATIRLVPDTKATEEFSSPKHALSIARIECHYFVNNCFFKTPNWILENASRLKDIPTRIVHGRYDVVCPVENAWELKKVLPHAELEIAPRSGHTAFEPEIVEALCRFTDGFRSS